MRGPPDRWSTVTLPRTTVTNRSTPMRIALGAGLIICAFIAAASAQQQPAPAVVPVGTVKAEKKPIAKTADFVGRISAINKVEVRARITGYLESVKFTEGDLVKDGAQLYGIEKGLFQAAFDQAAGVLDGSKARKLLTA